MGVGIAAPMAKYDVLDVDICTIGTTLPLPKQAKVGTLMALYEKCFGAAPECSWEIARNCSNRMVSVVLQPRDAASRRGLRSASKKKVKGVSYYTIPEPVCVRTRYGIIISYNGSEF